MKGCRKCFFGYVCNVISELISGKKNDFNRKLSIQRVPKLLFKNLICLALIGENAFLGG